MYKVKTGLLYDVNNTKILRNFYEEKIIREVESPEVVANISAK